MLNCITFIYIFTFTITTIIYRCCMQFPPSQYNKVVSYCPLVDLTITPQQMEALNYYKKNTMSVEIIKDDSLQKINFRVKNKVGAN